MSGGPGRDRHALRDFDRVLFWSVVALLVIGVLFVYSATIENVQVPTPLHTRQIVWAVLGLLLLFLMVALPPQFFYSTSYIFYGLALLLLLAVLVLVGGGSRWFDLPMGARFQPSEPAKVATVLAAARYLAGRNVTFRRARDFLIPMALGGIPFLLVARQPDLGTSVLFPVVIVPMLYWRGLPLRKIVLLCSPFLSVVTAFSPFTWGLMLLIIGLIIWRTRLSRGVAAAVLLTVVAVGVATPMAWDHLHDYQRQRILTFLNPQQDRLGAGYHIIQSTVAVGSGGLLGKGYLRGTQTKLNFLPEQHTDFIFSVISEETGLVGAMTVILLFLLVLYRALRAAAEVRNPFGQLVIVGAATILFFHFTVNVGMALGVLPITGLPLPFVSYGGSHLLSQLALVGIILGLRMRWMEY
jgi:rod shape determining protein RodA